jgi:anaerobic selenocysteine-containing dehydrogenase
LGIVAGDNIAVTSRRGSAQGLAHLTEEVLPGNLYMSMHFGSALGIGEGRLANILSQQSVYDTHSKQPELKYNAVRVSKV